jgi:Fic family protein
MYIHLKTGWPNFHWDTESILTLLTEVRYLQGKLLGKVSNLGFDLRNEAVLETLSIEIIKNSEIEGEILNDKEVRSSVARKLGLDFESNIHPSRYVEGVVEMMLDATQNYQNPLTSNQLFGWHSALFPTGRSGMYSILIGDWRKDTTGPMQVVSGGWGRERVHFEAPHSDRINEEMKQFLDWFNDDSVNIDAILKAAVAHLWFITIHPFDDGNGRITRAITDMQLAKSDGSIQRFYSMSSQILLERKAYYLILESTQKGSLDITTWINWFLDCLKKSIIASEITLSRVIKKAIFWKKNQQTTLNDRQKKIINLMLDDFKGKLFTAKWAKICKCSTDTALRDINDLVKKGVLKKADKGGRSTAYLLVHEEE